MLSAVASANRRGRLGGGAEGEIPQSARQQLLKQERSHHREPGPKPTRRRQRAEQEPNGAKSRQEGEPEARRDNCRRGGERRLVLPVSGRVMRVCLATVALTTMTLTAVAVAPVTVRGTTAMMYMAAQPDGCHRGQSHGTQG